MLTAAVPTGSQAAAIRRSQRRPGLPMATVRVSTANRLTVRAFDAWSGDIQTMFGMGDRMTDPGAPDRLTNCPLTFSTSRPPAC